MNTIFRFALVLLTVCALQAALSSPAQAQGGTQFKVGDRVEVDVNMSSYAENQKWRKGTVAKIEMWQGRVSGIVVKTDDGGEHMVGERHLRRLAEAATKPADKTPPRPPKEGGDPGAGRDAEKTDEEETAQFKVGDRVEVDSVMAREAKDSRWKKATVKTVDLKNRRYVVTLDDSGLDYSVLLRPGKVWIRALNDGSQAPTPPDCPFTEPPGKVTKTAAASAALFKRVIFEYRDSVKRGTKLGITFQVFEMGKAYTNVLTRKGRLLDFVPTNALVYPVKTRLLICEQFDTMIIRVVTEIEYACYRNEFGDWVCRNGAPKELERKSIYTK